MRNLHTVSLTYCPRFTLRDPNLLARVPRRINLLSSVQTGERLRGIVETILRQLQLRHTGG